MNHLLQRAAESRELRRLYPDVHWLTPLELLCILMLAFKPDDALWLKVNVPYDVALRLWPDRLPIVDLTVEGAVAPNIEWKFPVKERRREPRLR